MKLKKSVSLGFSFFSVLLVTMGMSTSAYAQQLQPSDVPPMNGNHVVQISTAAQLAYVDQHQNAYLGDNIQLTNNIDVSGYGWVPFGGNAYSPFSGTFNGQGHAIVGFSFSDTNDQYIGLFGETATGTIENLGVSTQVYGTTDIGVLVGQQDSGKIINTYATGYVSGGQDNGGLVGHQMAGGVISASFAAASVVGSVDSTDGGLVGFSLGTITNSYAAGTVSNGGSDGGLVGYGDGSITNCYASGQVSGANLRGGFAGNNEGTITGSFFDLTKNSSLDGIGSSTNPRSGVVGTSTSSMTQRSTFTAAGWDFASTWSIAPNINSGYPYLQNCLSSALTPSTTDAASNQIVPVTVAVYYGGSAVSQQWVSLSVPSGDGTWSTGSSVTNWVYTDSAGQYTGIWTTPNVTVQTPVVITAAVYGASVESTSTVTVEPPPVPVAPVNLQHSNVTSSGWTETWNSVPYASSYNVYLNGTFVGSANQTHYTFTSQPLGNTYSVTPGTTYNVTVVSVDSTGGSSNPSAADSVTTLYNSISVPTGTQGQSPPTPSGLSHSDVTDTGWKEAWNPVTVTGAGTVTYEVFLNGAKVGSTTQPVYNVTGVTAGTTYSVAVATIVAGQESGRSAPDTVTTTMPTPLTILTQFLPQHAKVGHPYSTQIVGSGGTPAFQWAISNGALPAGLTTTDDGVIRGTPTGPAGPYTFTVSVSDSNHQSSSRELTLWVNGGPPTPAMYAVFSGIKGQDSYAPDSFRILSMSYGVANDRNASANGVGASQIRLSEITFVKPIDSVTPQLKVYAETGKSFSGDFYIQIVVNGNQGRYFDVNFVGTISDAAAGTSPPDEAATESLSIIPKQESITYVEVKPDGLFGRQSEFKWRAAT